MTTPRTSLAAAMLATAMLFTGFRATAQDTVKSHYLEEVEITTQAVPSETKAQAPTQVVDARKMEQRAATQLSDALKQMAGVTLKDYGGVGGLKTVSARGLGSQFSTLTIDGVAVSDCQNGQADLGRYLTGNAAYVSFTSGMQNDLLQTARVFAAGNVVNMETKAPDLLPFEKSRFGVGLEGGSFGYFSPSLAWQQRLAKRLLLSFWGNYLRCNGDYPFRLYYTASHNDSSSLERRINSQARMGTLDANLFYTPSPNSTLTGKAHYMQAYHALPGPVNYYTQSIGSEHSEEKLFFAQLRYRHRFSEKWEAQVAAKYQRSKDVYEDTALLSSSTGTLRNEYAQNEGYASAALAFRPSKALSVGLATDEAANTLSTNLPHDNDAVRLSSLNVLSAAYQRQAFDATANLLGTFATETSRTQPADTVSRKLQYRRLSPYLAMSAAPFFHTGPPLLQGLRLRYFYKQTFRMPTFGEVYYVTMTRRLKPEEARQHNVGLTWTIGQDSDGRLAPNGSRLTLTLDGYLNHVDNKIVAIPIQNMYLWSMANFGRVEIKGLDARAETVLPFQNVQATLNLTYSYQQALDRSDAYSKTYGHQIPYTPRHSGGATLWLANKWVDFGYDAMFVGKRYYTAQNTEATQVMGYVDQGATLARKFLLPYCTLTARLRVQNVFNAQYEVVKSYPMMGRHFRLSLYANF
ncbi:MAG: TonB-dependent receptor plug domain-containing protein [Bacteroidales bacterium]|nr:TonB-dependent receptor plug domain-containing protein [Bacteroidales bacterium]